MKNLIIWIVLMGVIGYGGAKLYLHNEVSDTMDMIVLGLSPYADIEYDGVGSTLTGELTVDGVRVRVDGFADDLYIDRIGIDTPSFLSLLDLSDMSKLRSEGLPEYMGFLIEGLRMPANADYYQKFYDFSLQLRGITDAADPAAECAGKYGFSPAALTELGYQEQVMDMLMSFHDEETRLTMKMDVSV